MVTSKEMIKVVAKYSNSGLDTWKTGVLENLETVLDVVDRIKTIKNIPAEAPLRWKVVKFQIDKLGNFVVLRLHLQNVYAKKNRT